MKSLKPVVKKLLKRCIPALKAKKRNVQTTAPLTVASDTTLPLELTIPAVRVVPVSTGMPIPRIPSQEFEQFLLNFDEPARSPSVAHPAAFEARPTTPSSLVRLESENVNENRDVILVQARQQPAERVHKCDRDAIILQQNLILQRELAQKTEELEKEIEKNRQNQVKIDLQESTIRELEEAPKDQKLAGLQNLRTASLETKTIKGSNALKETIKAQDGEIERLRAQLLERDEAHRNQIEARERHELLEMQATAHTHLQDKISMQKKLRDKIAAKTALEAKLANAEAERVKAIARCEDEVRIARADRDRLSEQCNKLEQRVGNLVDTLHMYDSSEVWLECFEKNNAGREALDKIMFAKFLTPVECTSSENPDAMRLSELGPRVWKSSLGSPMRRSNRLRDTVRSSPMAAPRE